MERKDFLITRTKNYIEDNSLITPGERVLIACSGGADSVALLEVLKLLAHSLKYEIAVCHVNHNIRGTEAKDDALWIGNFCRIRGIDFCIKEINVPNFAKENKLSLEEAARILRYKVLNEVAREKNCSAIAVAHNKEDNAQTVIMNILRGSLLDGLTGIKAKNNNIIRPFLFAEREIIEDFCKQNKIAYRVDSTNQDKKYLRNKVRMELMPVLQKYNPQIVHSLCNMADMLSKDATFLKGLAQESFLNLAQRKNGDIIFPLEKLGKISSSLLSRIILLTMKTLATQDERAYFSSKHVADVLKLICNGNLNTQIVLPNKLYVKKDYSNLIFSKHQFKKDEKVVFGEYKLSIPGKVVLPNKKIIRASIFRGAKPKVRQHSIAVFPIEIAQEFLIVRTRLAGDVFCPSGMGGKHKKLKEFFIDSKIPFDKRDDIPLVLDKEGILWICGVRCAHRDVKKLYNDSWLYLEFFNGE